ncbi:hypothetical protein SAMN05421827_12849 [Pedobacter terrae]|uniref:Uncharacterized protein n=1 Tax=Pedobacter terrae TaxID=405671 RepID=A0A1G8D9Z1_9SPHI|nr:hypothetical protein [Pedobacter terrae]SDH54100.1 hypothetical protein SAMN05421827_12849 [Pedobacter terrae]
MKELEIIISKVKESLSAKEDEVAGAVSVNTYVHSTLENRKLEVALFENSAKQVTTDPTQKSTILANFERDAKALINEINKIEV